MSAGVVVVTDFCRKEDQKKSYKGYIDYIDRSETERARNTDQWNLYQDYMGNPEKTSGLFTDKLDRLSNVQKKELKDVFSRAYDNGSLMWQTVISFENPWLEENGVYDCATQSLDEAKMREVTRYAIRKMLKNEKLDHATWSAAFHYNTDNLHIHVAIVEEHPMREKKMYIQYKDTKRKIPFLDSHGQPVMKEEYKGRFKQSSIDLCKSAVANQLLQERNLNQEINNIIRKNIVQRKVDKPLVKDAELVADFMYIYESLPNCPKNMWNYNNNIMAKVRPMLDQLSAKYIEKYHKDDMDELKELLQGQSEIYQASYGGKRASYSEGKIKDLYIRLGNAILKEMREYGKRQKADMDILEPDVKDSVDLVLNVDEEMSDLQVDDTDGLEEIDLHFSSPNLKWSDRYKKAMSIIYSDDPDYVRAHSMLAEEYGAGNVLAACTLGDMYRLGRGCEIDLTCANGFYEDAVFGLKSIIRQKNKKMHGYAEYRLGKLYQYGYGVERDYQKAFELFDQAVGDGCMSAYFSLGNMYFYGRGTEKDYEEAEECYLKADKVIRKNRAGKIISEGNAYAEYRLGEIYTKGLTERDLELGWNYYQKAYKKFSEMSDEDRADDNLYYRLGFMLEKGLGVETDIDAAQEYYEKAAKLGNSNAAYKLALIYLDQDNPELIHKAVEWLEKAADQGDSAIAQYALGKIYLDTEKGMYDLEKAVEYLEKSAEQGNEYGQYTLGKVFLDSEKGLYDFEKAVEYLEQSAAQENEYAQYTLGKIYLDPEKGMYDVGKAIEYLEQSAGQDNGYAQYALGKLYLDQSVEMYDPQKAATYLKLSAEKGNQYAQYALGKMYLDKNLDMYDPKEGITYLERSAEQGNQFAQFRLGLAYYRGEYVKCDYQMARDYFEKSAEQGNQFARQMLEYMDHPFVPFKAQGRFWNYHFEKAWLHLRRSMDNRYARWVSMQFYHQLQEEEEEEKDVKHGDR